MPKQESTGELGWATSGNLVIDRARYQVTIADERVGLSLKDYELLFLLASAPGRVFTRDELLAQVWRRDRFTEGRTRTVDVHIRRLRSKLEDTHHTFIETIWNMGYRLNRAHNGHS